MSGKYDCHRDMKYRGECIRTQKVYDWVTTKIKPTETVSFTAEERRRINAALEDEDCCALRVVCSIPDEDTTLKVCRGRRQPNNDGFFCEQLGEKRNVRTEAAGGEMVKAQLVDLMFCTDLRVQVIDCDGEAIVDKIVRVAEVEDFVLCYPDGTELFCRIFDIFCKVTSDMIITDTAPASVDVKVTFCVDVQVEAEVKLEVPAKFCKPRRNNLIGNVRDERCDRIEFPDQCPSIFPAPKCKCSVEGYGQGTKNSVTLNVEKFKFCKNCNPAKRDVLKAIIEGTPSNDYDGTFVAREFDFDSVVCKETRWGTFFSVMGNGSYQGETMEYHFKFSIMETGSGQKMQLEIFDEMECKFDSGHVPVTSGEFTIEKCEKDY